MNKHKINLIIFCLLLSACSINSNSNSINIPTKQSIAMGTPEIVPRAVTTIGKEIIEDVHISQDGKGIFLSTSGGIYYYDLLGGELEKIYNEVYLGKKFGVIDDDRLMIVRKLSGELCVWNFELHQYEGCVKFAYYVPPEDILDEAYFQSLNIFSLSSNQTKEEWLVYYGGVGTGYAVVKKEKPRLVILVQKRDNLAMYPTKIALSKDGASIVAEYTVFGFYRSALEVYFSEHRTQSQEEIIETDQYTLSVIMKRRLDQIGESGKSAWNFSEEDLEYTGLIYGGKFQTGRKWEAGTLHFSLNDQYLFFSEGKNLHLIDSEKMAIIDSIELTALEENQVYSNIMALDQQRFVVRSNDGKSVLLFSYENNKLLLVDEFKVPMKTEEDNFDHLDIFPDSNRILISGEDGFYCWNLDTDTTEYVSIR